MPEEARAGLSIIPSSWGLQSPGLDYRYASHPLLLGHFRILEGDGMRQEMNAADQVDIFGCPDNIFFVKTNQWVWTLVGWQILQVGVLSAQDRFGPAFL